MAANIDVFNSGSPFPYVLVFSTTLAIICLATVYISSSLILS